MPSPIPAAALTAAAHAVESQPAGSSAAHLARVAIEAAAPEMERGIRARIAASLRRAAEGRREYAAMFSGVVADEHRADFDAASIRAASCYESAAAIIEDPANLLDVIPSWRWTDEETRSVLREDGDDA
jgi:hypothetical protein